KPVCVCWWSLLPTYWHPMLLVRNRDSKTLLTNNITLPIIFIPQVIRRAYFIMTGCTTIIGGRPQARILFTGNIRVSVNSGGGLLIRLCPNPLGTHYGS